MTPSIDIESLRERLLRGDRAALARAITLAESKRADHRALASDLIDSVLPQTGRAIRVGITGVPGVGKTMLAKALGRSIACSVRRVQFTPDLLPSDITGVSVFNQETRDFDFKPGGIFANIVVGDEINRASPKTQSAMLESME